MTYCSDHDPLLAAGRVHCNRCGRAAYPTDAEWFGELIMATFPAPCEHARPYAWLIDPDAFAPSPWCGRITRFGDPCRRRAPVPGRPCHVHDPDRQPQRRGQRQGRGR